MVRANVKNPKIFSRIQKKFIPIYNKKGEIKKKIQNALRKNPKSYTIPPFFVYDTVDKELVAMKIRGTNMSTKEFKDKAKKRPRTLKFNTSQVYDFTNDRLLKRSDVLTKKTRILKPKYSQYNQEGNVIVARPLDFQDVDSIRTFNNVKKVKRLQKQGKKHSGFTIYKRYIIEDMNLQSPFTKITELYEQFGAETPEEKNMLIEDNLKSFVDTIKYQYMKDFTPKQRSAEKARVLLAFDDGARKILRFFNIEDLDNLRYYIDNWESGNNDWGSDVPTHDINIENLNFDWFEINLQGPSLVSAGGTAKVASKYWYCIQPRTEFNCCLDGAINKGLKLKSTYRRVRDKMVKNYPNIQHGQMVSFEDIKYYEQEFNVAINVYEDSPHFKNNNCIRESQFQSEKTLSILYKDEHYALIDKPKLKITELNTFEKRQFGVFKKPKQTAARLLSKKELKERREVLVIFDIETIFDKNDDNYLKTYGVSWVVWEKDEYFNYNPKIHNEEPYCYYEKGLGCLKKFLKFLLNPPNDVVYRPIDFNNSRFDNFAVCKEAARLGVLKNVFMADGSILYLTIEGCANFWDASRFLTGQSLDSACKSYKTNPKKAKDLIDHYQIQCYFEANGWNGLNELLDSNKDLVLYNKIDCLCLLDLVLKMRSAYKTLFNTDVLDYLTISSMGYSIQAKLWNGNVGLIEDIKNDATLNKKEKIEMVRNLQPKFNIVKPHTYEEDLFFRKSLTAGRTQSFYGKLDYKAPLAMGDIKSLYPTVMGNYGGNVCEYPYGNYHYTKVYKKDKLGIYNVNLIHQKCKWKNQEKVYAKFKEIKDKTGYDLFSTYAPNVIPKRSKDEPLDWFIKGSILDINLTSVDIEVLKWATEDENCVEIIDGYYWDEKRTDLFLDFLDPPRLEKTKQDRLKAEGSKDYNVAIREGCKGISNCLSGKLLEAIHEDCSDIFTSKSYMKYHQDEDISQIDIQDLGGGLSFVVGKKDKEAVFNNLNYDKRKPSYLGMFVYSYARKLMYQKILSRYITLYMDTDSACMPYCEWERLCEEYKDKDFVDTGEYGCIEEEVCSKDEKGNVVPASRLIAISPKNYCVINEHDESFSKRKFKGVRKTDFFMPLKAMGTYHKVKGGKYVGSAIDKVRNMSQEDIRYMREFKCCPRCINKVLKDKDARCKRCVKAEGRIIWGFEERAKYQASLNELEHFCNSNNEEKEQVHISFDKDMNIIGSRKLDNVFQLKQRYLIKII